MGSNYTCLVVFSLDPALKKKYNYYPQVLLKDCKYIEKKVVRHMFMIIWVSLMKNK